MSAVSLGALRALPNLLEDDMLRTEYLDAPTVPTVVALLRSTDEQEKEEALSTLAEMVDGAFGEDGTVLGEEMRANGGIALLSWLLADPSPDVQQMSLMILGNLCSDSVDANSSATKQALLRSGGARALLSCVHTEDPAVLLFACGALQNLCYEPEWSELAVSFDVHLRLESLLTHEDGMIVRYASGALQNITRALQLEEGTLLSPLAMQAVKERALEHRLEEFIHRRAISKISEAYARIPEQLRQQRHENGRRRRQRAAQLDRSASRSSSRPSSAASSKSTSSYVSARSSMTSGSAATSTFAAGASASSPLAGHARAPPPGPGCGVPTPPVSPGVTTYF